MDFEFHDELGNEFDMLQIYLRKNIINPVQKMSEYKEFTELTIAQRKIMALLDVNSNLTISEIAIHTNLSYTNLSKIIESLENKGYLRRDISPKDRRIIIVKLLPEGKRVINEANDINTNNAMNYLNSLLDDEDQKKLLQLCRELTSLCIKIGENRDKNLSKNLNIKYIWRVAYKYRCNYSYMKIY